MRNLILSVFFLSLSVIVFAQSSDQSEMWLWEVTGPNINGKSYLFGSMHLNDSRIFDFDNAVVEAIESCEQFAGEIDYGLIDSLVIQTILDEISNSSDTEEENLNVKKKKDKATAMFEGMDVNGEHTLQDIFLYQIARENNLRASGLEEFDLELNILDGIEDRGGPKYGTKNYENYIEIYNSGDSLLLLSSLGNSVSDDEEFLERNKIQANSFLNLAKDKSTFGVVGCAHLVGDNNVLSILIENNCKVKRVKGLGSSTKVENYDLTSDAEYKMMSSEGYSIKIPSFLDSRWITNERVEMLIGSNFSQGLISATMLVPGSIEQTNENIIDEYLESVLPDTAYTKSQTIEEDGVMTISYVDNSDLNKYRINIIRRKSLISVQVIFGISQKAIDNPIVEKMARQEYIVDRIVWNETYSDVGSFSFLFPENVDFVSKWETHPEHPNRSEVLIMSKSYVDPHSGDEYLVRYNTSPTGVMYVEQHADIELISDHFSNLFQAPTERIEYNNHGELLAADVQGRDKNGRNYFYRYILKGSQAYISIQLTNNTERNEEFFKSLKLHTTEEFESTKFQYPDAGFSISAPKEHHEILRQDEDLTEEYHFNSENTGAFMSLEFEPFDKYAELDITDSTFTYENFIDTLVFDSLVDYQVYSYKNTCPGYLLTYENDSTFMRRMEFGVYCNGHLVNLEMAVPVDFVNTNYLGEIINSIQFELSEDSFTALVSDKRDIVLKDLKSKDSTIFFSALDAFNNRSDYEDKHVSALSELLNMKLLDEDSLYNAKYAIISDLHSKESKEVENCLSDYYFKTFDETNKARILESMALRESMTSKDRLIELLKNTDSNLVLPSNIYDSFRDSTEIFERYYEDLKELSKQGIGAYYFYHMINGYLSKDEIDNFILMDTLYYDDIVQERISGFYDELEDDPKASIDNYVMDYLLNRDLGSTETKLYEVLQKQEDVYGKYRVIYSKLKSGKPIDSELISEVMQDEYYRYYVYYNHFESNVELPKEYMNKADIAQSFMKYMIRENEGVECKSCQILDEYKDAETNVGNMVAIKCNTDSSTYFIGCIGSFTSEGSIDINNDISTYYSSSSDDLNLTETKKKFVDYYNSQEE